MEEQANNGRFRFSRKEFLMFLPGTALALGSFKLEDPWVVIPMLALSGLAFVGLCVYHQGSRLGRTGVALVVVCVLVFIGWRGLRRPSGNSVAGQPIPPSEVPNRGGNASPQVAQNPAPASLPPEGLMNTQSGRSHPHSLNSQITAGPQQPPQSTPPLTSAPGSLVQSNSGGAVNVQQGTTGSNSLISDSPITIGEIPAPDRHLSDSAKTILHDGLLKETRSKTFRVVATGKEAQKYGKEIRDAFQSTEWVELGSLNVGVGFTAASGDEGGIDEPPLCIFAPTDSDNVRLVQRAFVGAKLNLPYCPGAYPGPVSLGIPDVVIAVGPQPKIKQQ